MIPLVDQLVEAGVHLETGECYSFLTPPILGGEYTVKNTVVLPITGALRALRLLPRADEGCARWVEGRHQRPEATGFAVTN